MDQAWSIYAQLFQNVMNINLTDQESIWLHALLLVHECELSDSILEKLMKELEKTSNKSNESHPSQQRLD